MEIQLLAEAINKFSAIICGQRRWDEIRKEMLEECKALFKAEVCAVFLTRDDEVVLEDHIGYTKSDGREIALTELREHLRYRLGPLQTSAAEPTIYDGITGQVASTGVEFSYDSSEPRPLSWQGKPDQLGIWDPRERKFRCMFAVPLQIANTKIGVLKVENKKDSACFDDLDKNVLRTFANFFSIAERFSYFLGLPYDKLFTTTLEWLARFDKQNLYQNMVEFCAAIFQANVCALFVRPKGDEEAKMALVAGRLRSGDPMDPEMLQRRGKDPFYRIGSSADGGYDGLTGRIATTGKSIKIDCFEQLSELRHGGGKWDEAVWGGDPSTNFGSMIGVPLKVGGTGQTIGILKVERDKTAPLFNNEDLDVLAQVGTSFAKHLDEADNSLAPGREYEFRIPRVTPQLFESKPIGGVLIRHVMTSICQSDLYYFKHDKDSRKLDERLPMVLGHETVGEILRTTPDARDMAEHKILTGDKVFVIPLIPCGSCKVCKGEYGENYCPSSRFMASNAPGSLRSSYQYDPRLTLRIQDLAPQLAVFAEPMANVVQMLNELGFKKNAINLDMQPFEAETFTYFRVGGQQFTSIFNTIIDQLPSPRTLFALADSDRSGPKVRHISPQGIMHKGLGLLGQSGQGKPQRYRPIDEPRVLILGTSVSAYLLAAALVHVYGIPKTQIAVTGRTPTKLEQFKSLADVRLRIPKEQSLDSTVALLVSTFGQGEKYDIVFECIGGNAIQEHTRLALEVLKSKGILAMFGISDDLVEIDFSKILSNELYIKGFYRASLNAYKDALNYITQHAAIRNALEQIIDKETPVDGYCGTAHEIRDASHLTLFFKAAGAYRAKLGRMIVGQLG